MNCSELAELLNKYKLSFKNDDLNENYKIKAKFECLDINPELGLDVSPNINIKLKIIEKNPFANFTFDIYK